MSTKVIVVGVMVLAIAGVLRAWFFRARGRWVTWHVQYEGFPLFLRRPTFVDTPHNRKSYPTLAVITLEFSERFPDGRPEPAYNYTLFDLDLEVVRAFDAGERGVPVLVETFGGKRHFYFYVAAETDVASIVTPITQHYLDKKLTWKVHPDDKWAFIDKYAKEFF